MFTNGIVGAWSISSGLKSFTMAGVTDPDRCPGLRRPHLAADGAMVRIRVPGGQTTGTRLRQLSRIAERFGSADIQLTSRASLQLRGLADPVPDSLIRAVQQAGFLPSETHERVRNIVASPLTGISGAMTDVRPLVATLDARLCAAPRLSALPGRFLFALDDGRGDLSETKFDLGYRAIDLDQGWLLIGSSQRGVPVSAADAVEALLELAHHFLAAGEGAGDTWPVRGRANWARTVPGVRTISLPTGTTGTPLGAIAGAASVQVPLALLTPAQAATVEAYAPGPVVITPSRGLVLSGAARHLPELVAAGMIDDPDSPWSAISACVGAPACNSSLINTRAYATALAQSESTMPRTHISGCERRCGAPAGDHRDLVAPDAADLLRLVGRAQ
jgi:precorrin-3B synthase